MKRGARGVTSKEIYEKFVLIKPMKKTLPFHKSPEVPKTHQKKNKKQEPPQKKQSCLPESSTTSLLAICWRFGTNAGLHATSDVRPMIGSDWEIMFFKKKVFFKLFLKVVYFGK